RQNEGLSLDVNSVASFFVSRVDTNVDRKLEELGRTDLAGTAAIANARHAYRRFKEIFSGPRWEALRHAGAAVQRPLWASTGTKNPAYSDTKYIDGLVGAHTVNTMPMATLLAVADHLEIGGPTAEQDPSQDLAALAEAGINMDQVTDELLGEGVKRAMDDTVAQRVWRRDPSLWGGPGVPEIEDRLGWLTVSEPMLEQAPELHEFAAACRADGFTDAVLLGMGGSSLGPEVIRRSFGSIPGALRLQVLDSTHPDEVLRVQESVDLEKTLFVVSSKSGSTIETLSHYRYFKAMARP